MVCAPAVKLTEIGNHYGFRTWIAYGLKQRKDALSWADFRMTSYEQIEKWWELVMSAFLMVSLFADAFNDTCPLAHQQFAQHSWWNNQSGWKHLLNNLRLIIQPLICFNWLKRCLEVFPIQSLEAGFKQLMHQMNQFVCPLVHYLNLQLTFHPLRVIKEGEIGLPKILSMRSWFLRSLYLDIEILDFYLYFK